ncbi:sulfotransferase [Pseudomonadota bacterium]
MGLNVAKEYRGLRFINHWRYTLKIARTLVKVRPSITELIKARCAAFREIENPVFIIGCPRSGTTYLGEVLEKLPNVSYFFEPPTFKFYSRLIYQKKRDSKDLRRLYDWCFRTLLFVAPGTGPRILEKNPNHTFIAKELIEAYPSAKLIVLSRDAREVTLSLIKKPWHLASSKGSGKREPGGYLYGPYAHFYIEEEHKEQFEITSDIHRCIWIWRRHAEMIEKIRTELPDSCQRHINYEDLILKPESTLTGVLDFIGENDESSISAVMEASKAGRTDSIGSWKRAMSSKDLALIEREAGELLCKAGRERGEQ